MTSSIGTVTVVKVHLPQQVALREGAPRWGTIEVPLAELLPHLVREDLVWLAERTVMSGAVLVEDYSAEGVAKAIQTARTQEAGALAEDTAKLLALLDPAVDVAERFSTVRSYARPELLRVPAVADAIARAKADYVASIRALLKSGGLDAIHHAMAMTWYQLDVLTDAGLDAVEVALAVLDVAYEAALPPEVTFQSEPEKLTLAAHSKPHEPVFHTRAHSVWRVDRMPLLCRKLKAQHAAAKAHELTIKAIKRVETRAVVVAVLGTEAGERFDEGVLDLSADGEVALALEKWLGKVVNAVTGLPCTADRNIRGWDGGLPPFLGPTTYRNMKAARSLQPMVLPAVLATLKLPPTVSHTCVFDFGVGRPAGDAPDNGDSEEGGAGADDDTVALLYLECSFTLGDLEANINVQLGALAL